MNFSESVLITGCNNRIIIRYPSESSEEVINSMLEHMQNREIWSIADYPSATAYQGKEQLFMVNMNIITGVGI